MIRETPPGTPGYIECEKKIAEVEEMKANIRSCPDHPLGVDMNKYLARARSAILTKKRDFDDGGQQLDGVWQIDDANFTSVQKRLCKN